MHLHALTTDPRIPQELTAEAQFVDRRERIPQSLIGHRALVMR
jgi:hypothetical protein